VPGVVRLVQRNPANREEIGLATLASTCARGIAEHTPLLAHIRAGGGPGKYQSSRRAVGPQSKKARRSRSWAGAVREPQLLREAIDALAVLTFGGLNLQPHLLAQRAADEPADTVTLMPMSA